MTTFDYDLFVIGAGSGGTRASRISAANGARVAIAEEFRFGGTCVIRGCVPKKLMVYASRFSDAFADAVGFGWTVGNSTFDWSQLVAAKDQEIARLEAVYRNVLASHGVAIVSERAVIEGPHHIKLQSSGQTVSAETILIATGGRPFVDDTIPGSANAITSDEVFDLKQQPRRIMLIGGGYIAVEFASIFLGLGSEVTLVYRGDEILRGFDDDLRRNLSAALEHRGIAILRNTDLQSITPDGDAFTVKLSNGQSYIVDQVMTATGRLPNTAGLGLDNAGVKLSARGAICVDDGSQSSVPSIYAVGDVTDRVALTPVAIREGHAFADSRYGGKPWQVDYDMIPTAVFTTPEIGTVGLTEVEARARHGDIDIYKSSFRPMLAVLANRDERTHMKMLVKADDQKVVGIHILGPDAAEMVQLAAVAMRMGATKADFDATMALHPSAAEELVTLTSKWVTPERS